MRSVVASIKTTEVTKCHERYCSSCLMFTYVYRLSQDCHSDINREVSTAQNCRTLSGDTVKLVTINI